MAAVKSEASPGVVGRVPEGGEDTGAMDTVEVACLSQVGMRKEDRERWG